MSIIPDGWSSEKSPACLLSKPTCVSEADDTRPRPEDKGFHSLFFEDKATGENVNDGKFEQDKNAHSESIHRTELTNQTNATTFSNGDIDLSSGYSANMSAAVGEIQSYDIQSRLSGHSRSTSGASGPRERTEESSSGVYVVQDSAGDLYVVEDISDTTRETATINTTTGRIVAPVENETSHTIDTTQSSIGSFDFLGLDSRKISVDSSDVNYGKAQEVLSTLLNGMSSADRGLAVTDFQNDSVERGNLTYSGVSVTSDRDIDILASQANTQTAMTSSTEDRDMALHEDVYKKTVLNVVTDEQDRPLWTEQTTDTQVKAWMDNGQEAENDSAYKTSITLTSGGQHQQAMDLITPAPDYPGTEADIAQTAISTYSMTSGENQLANTSFSGSLRSGPSQPASPEPVIQDVTTGVTVTTTTETVIGQQVEMLIDVPKQSQDYETTWNQSNRSLASSRSRSLRSDDRNKVTNGYNSDSSLSSEDGRKMKSYNVRSMKSSSLDRADSSGSAGKKRYITRISSIPKSSRPGKVEQQTFYTADDTMTTRIHNTQASSFGEADSQYGSQTSRGTSGDTSPPRDDSPRYRVVRAEMSPTSTLSTPQKHTIYRHVEEKPTKPDFYQHESFRSDESVNRDGNLWRVNSPVRRSHDTSQTRVVDWRSEDNRSDRSSPERFRVSKTLSAEDLFSQHSPKRSSVLQARDSFGSETNQHLYRTVTSSQSTPRKRRHGSGNSSDSENEGRKHSTSMYRVSNVGKDELLSSRRQNYEPEEDEANQQVYRVVSVTPSDRSRKAEKRVIQRSFNSRNRQPSFSDDETFEPQSGKNYRIAKTASTEDLIVTRKVSQRSDSRGSKYRGVTSPTRFDSGYFDEPVPSPRTPISPTHTTVIRLDPGSRRGRSVDTSSRDSLYKVVNVKSNENLTNGSMWGSSTSPTHYRAHSDSDDDERQGKYRVRSSKYPLTSSQREYPSSPETERKSRKDVSKYYVQRTFSPGRVENFDPVSLKRVRSISPKAYRSPSPNQWHKSSMDVGRGYTLDYDDKRRSMSYTNLTPKESRSYVVFNTTDDHGRTPERTDSQRYRTEKTFFLSSSPDKPNRNLSRSFSNDITVDSGTGTEIVISDNEGNGELIREQKYQRVEQIYQMRSEPLHSDIPDETEDLKVERGKILIRNKIENKEEDDFDDNVNVFDHSFHLEKDNPLYQSDPDIYRRLEEEQEEQVTFRDHVTQDITFDTVDRIAHTHAGRNQVQLSQKPVKRQNLSALLLSKLASIDSKDIRQNIDVEHHNEEIYGDLDFIHADGSQSGSGNTDNFDAVNEKVDLTLKDGKAFVIVKVIAERVVPIDYEFNVWRKSSAIVTRQIEIDLFANEQRRRLYHHVMENAGVRGAIEGGAYGPHSMTSPQQRNDKELSSMETLKLFSQILSVAEGQGDNDDTEYTTRQVQGRLPSTHDILY